MHLFPIAPEDFAALSTEDLLAFIAQSAEVAADVGADPASFVTETRDEAALLAEMQAGVAALAAARTELAARDTDDDEVEDDPEVVEEPAAETAAVDPAAFADLASEAAELATIPEPVEVAPVEAVEAEPIVASATPARRTAPARSRSARPAEQVAPRISLTAAAPNLGHAVGAEIDPLEAAKMMERRRREFGIIAQGTSGEKVPIARADWSGLYPDDRKLQGGDFARNQELIAPVVDERTIVQAFQARRKQAADNAGSTSLVASGGLCAPVTPYYQLAMVSSASRPVRASLAAFNADRGGIRFATPATLASVTTGVGRRTAANDFAGGTEGVKTCQVVACPPFQEADVAVIFHCLEFGNLGARTFPERVAQWNSLTLAAQARLAETALLDGIDDASTQVTAATTGLGAMGDLLGEILVAAAAMRSRHRMDLNAVLRIILPAWTIGLLTSDTIRTQFERFGTNEAMLTAFLREHNIEPTFHIDGSTGDAQVFGAQAAGTLLPFPAHVKWWLFPEGSFLFLDGGTLELGLVRDSSLNSTNDFQIFGETFENAAFIGVESIAVTSAVCDSGTVAAPHATTCPTYA